MLEYNNDIKPDDGDYIGVFFPFLYLENKSKPIFSIWNFFVNVIRGLIEGFIIFIVLTNALGNTIADSNGNYADLWFISVNMFTIIILVVSVRVLVVQKYYTLFNVVTMLFTTFFLYAIFVIYVDTSDSFNSYATMSVAFNSSALWLSTVLVTGACFAIDYGSYSWFIIFSTDLTERLRILINDKGRIDKEEDVPEEFEEWIKLFKKVTNESRNHFIIEDDVKKTEKIGLNDNTHEVDLSVNETKKNL